MRGETLETERLWLRQFRESDLDAYAALCADPEVMRYLSGKPFSRAETWRHLAVMLGQWQLRGYGMWALEEKASGRLLGRSGINHGEGWPGFEIGWTLAREHWGRGFATEAARAALEHSFGTLGQRHVISLIQPANVASIRVAERLGERLEDKMEFFGNEVLVYGIERPAAQS